MQSVPTVYYVALSAILFTLGVLGVLLRRNAIIIFMSVELMLNSANLVFVAFAREFGQQAGQVFVFFVMAVAAAATAMLWSEIILPITPPAEFAPAISSVSKFSAFAVTTCKLPNSALADVSLPVRNTPSHPSIALK